MIFEIEDIINQQSGMGHIPWPEGTTIGRIMEHERLRGVEKTIASVYVNGMEISDWKSIIPGKGDKVKMRIAPKGPFTPFLIYVYYAVMILSAIASITQFIISMVASPAKPSKGTGGRDSQVYSFDGIQTRLTPGNPIPVTYGQHFGGGQMLSAFVDVFDSGKKQQLSMLVGYGEGQVTDISCVRINDTPIGNIKNATATIRLGTQSQAPISGFSLVKNTFSDQREVASGFPIVYSTVTNSATGVQLQVSAGEGLIWMRDTARYEATMDYLIERRPTGGGAFTTVMTRQFKGKTMSPLWDAVDVSVPTPGAYDFRLTFVGQHPIVATGGSIYEPRGLGSLGRVITKGRLWLTNVTEKEGITYAFSGIAHVGVRALATSQLNGQIPNVVALITGRLVEVYSTTAVKTITWTQNPAWGLADYMTNSIYGMGAYIRTSDLNLQSFIDFATLCNSQVPNGKGGLEDQHHLDLVMDTRKSHWQWVQDILSLYKSGIIYSQQQWKIITDRQDLPLRQVFHSGNIVPGKMNIKIGGDPMRPNQVNVSFANQLIDYEQDVIYVQDSASVAGAGDPIKDYSMELRGIARETEAIRMGRWDLERKRSIRRELNFETGLEGIAVEPGDMCRVGIVSTNYDMGWGGRILDGSSRHVVLDREITVQSGYTYDLFLWHVQADTPETRTIATTVPAGTSSFTTAVISPTSGFNFQAVPDDRWSIGVTSRDLMLCQVKQVSGSREGRTEIVAEQFIALNPTTPTGAKLASDILKAPAIGEPPAQPVKVVATEVALTLKDGSVVSNIIIGVSPAPLFEGGRLTAPGTLESVTLALASSHNPNPDALIGEQLRFISGPASGMSPVISAWGGAPSFVASVYPAFAAGNVPASGDPYQLIKNAGLYAGMDVLTVSDSTDPSSPLWTSMGIHYGTEITIPGVSPQSINVSYKLNPISDRGSINENGSWVVSLTTFGDTVAPDAPANIFAIAGTGKDINVHVVPTSVADLWGHEFFRHTTNNFAAASLVAFVDGDIFHDTNINVGSQYYYWVRARDMTYNVGSWIGPTSITIGGITADDIGSGAITGFAEYVGDSTITGSIIPGPGLAIMELANIVINTSGGPVLVAGKATILNRDGQVVKITMDLRSGSGNTFTASAFTGVLLDRTQQSMQGAGGGNTDMAHLAVHKVDTPLAGRQEYKLWGIGSAGVGNDQLWDVSYRHLQAVELKK